MGARTSKIIVITGASSGIGAEAARALSKLGHRVVVVGRNPDRTRQVAADIDADYLLADFADLGQVRGLAAQLLERYPRIDVLANNAGGIFTAHRSITKDRHELTMQVNYLAPFLLTNLLLDRLLASRAAVINTSSMAHRFGRLRLNDLDSHERYGAFRSYATTKLANILHANELHRRYWSQGLAAVSFHPGVIASSFAARTSPLLRSAYRPPLNRIMGTPIIGADTLVWLADGTPGVDWRPGGYYVERRPARPSTTARDAELARRLRSRTYALVSAA